VYRENEFCQASKCLRAKLWENFFQRDLRTRRYSSYLSELVILLLIIYKLIQLRICMAM